MGLDTFHGPLSYGQPRDSLGATAMFLLLAVPLRIAGRLALTGGLQVHTADVAGSAGWSAVGIEHRVRGLSVHS